MIWAPAMLKKPTSAFSSESRRDSFIKFSDVPGPGEYSIKEGATKVDHTFAWSKSKAKRGYEIDMALLASSPIDMSAIDKARISMRTAGNYRGKYLGKQNASRAPAMHTFGADKDRFKNSFCGRLDLIAQIPGPGTYSLPKLGQDIKNGIRFTASGNGRVPFLPPSAIPGPAYYSPKRHVKTAQCQNLSGRWV